MSVLSKGVEWLRERVREKLGVEDDPDAPAPLVPVALSPEAKRMREEGEAAPNAMKPAPKPEAAARGSVAERLAHARARRRM